MSLLCKPLHYLACIQSDPVHIFSGLIYKPRPPTAPLSQRSGLAYSAFPHSICLCGAGEEARSLIRIAYAELPYAPLSLSVSNILLYIIYLDVCGAEGCVAGRERA